MYTWRKGLCLAIGDAILEGLDERKYQANV